MDDYIETASTEETAPIRWICEGAYSSRYRGLYFFWLALAGLISFGIYVGLKAKTWELATRAATIFGLLLCVIHFWYVTRSKPVNYLAPDLLFLAAYMMFHFGYLTLWLIGLAPPGVDIFPIPHLYPETMFIVNLGIIGFLFGYELAAKRMENYEVCIIGVPSAAWTLLGLLLMVFSIAVFIAYVTLVGLDTFMAKGSAVVAHMDRYVADVRLWRLRSRIFATGFGIYIVSVALRHGRLFKGKLGITLFAIYLVSLILEGGRTGVATVAIVPIVVRHYLIKPIKLRWLLAIAVCTLFVFTAMRVVRDITVFDVAKMVEEYEYAREAGEVRWYNIFAETGSSVRTINMTTSIVPGGQPYWRGWSYFQATVHIIPYLQGRLAHILGAGPAKWLTYTIKGLDAGGLGFSIAGEGYLNFGLIGVFFHMFFLGVLLRRIYIWFASSLSASRSLVFFVSLGLFVILTRNHVDLLFQPLVQTIVLAWLLRRLLGEKQLLLSDLEYDRDTTEAHPAGLSSL